MSSAHRTMVTSSYGEYKEAEISGSLRFKSGDAGGQRSACYCTDTIGALCARDYKGIGNQFVDEGKLIVEVHRDDC